MAMPSDFYSSPDGIFANLPPGLPRPPDFPSPEKARRQAKEFCTSILASWSTLNTILNRHEAVLRKRWLKKTKEQRKKILTSAFPDIPSTHRPDYNALRKGRGGGSRDAYLRPYINIEDLVEAKTLLLFLNARGRNPPSMFAHADLDAMHLGLVSGTICPVFLNEYTMFLEGETVNSYGRLVSWNDDDEAFDIMYSGRGVHPGEGLLILETQQGTLEFLLNCCRGILHDMDSAALVDPNIPIQPEPPAIVREPTEWPTMASIAAESPYRVPANIDFERLRAVFAARCSAAADHILTLREDPGYFCDALGDCYEHRQEPMLDVNKKPHPVFGTHLFWARVYGSVIGSAYVALIGYDSLYHQVERLITLRAKYSAKISPKAALPREYMKALLVFRESLDIISKGSIEDLKKAVPASPPIRSLFIREQHAPGSSIIPLRSKDISSDYFFWLFQALWDEEQLFLCRLPDLADEIERLVNSDPKEKAKFSPFVTDMFSDLGLLAGALREVNTYFPWAAGMEQQKDMSYPDGEIFEEAKGLLSLAVNISKYFKDKELVTLKLETPFDGKFTYPSDKRKTRQHVEAMRKAEQNLDSFWETIDLYYRRNTDKTLLETFHHLLPNDRQLERTPEWVPLAAESKLQPALGASDNMHQPFSQLNIQDEIKTPTRSGAEEKVKIKTRGTPCLASQQPQPSEPDIGTTVPHHGTPRHIPDVQPTLHISKRALKVFSTLFHDPSQADQPGEIPWSDFLHAMVSAGFGPVKLYGSVWQFTPTKLDVSRSIQFHEPHPRNKIPFKVARRFGRRLNRAYGWHGAMFTLAE
ncbi:hypothetical protein AJ78_02895 [Emergomyces pasteurianus Ep9510]|uniref:Uncharacterized protein n=1 Tax=Emergomyces pasteurianus Ep9510 TaxID=1447872 RepID=A0A1J9PKI5_9EURO|nr:hypothetical protein AJ78_02895 [Emergomyces pasteurianus Ep9510]